MTIKTTDRSSTTPEDHYKFFKMLDDFLYQIKDDTLREQLGAALERERQRYERQV